MSSQENDREMKRKTEKTIQFDKLCHANIRDVQDLEGKQMVAVRTQSEQTRKILRKKNK